MVFSSNARVFGKGWLLLNIAMSLLIAAMLLGGVFNLSVQVRYASDDRGAQISSPVSRASDTLGIHNQLPIAEKNANQVSAETLRQHTQIAPAAANQVEEASSQTSASSPPPPPPASTSALEEPTSRTEAPFLTEKTPPPTTTTSPTLPPRQVRQGDWLQKKDHPQTNPKKDPQVETAAPNLQVVQAELVNTIQQLDRLRSKGEAGGSRLAGELLFADGKGNARQVKVFRNSGGRRHNPIQPLFLQGLRKLSKPAFVHFGYEDHCPWYHVRFDPNCELSKGIVALTKKYPMFFWAHWNPTIVNESTGQIGTRMVPIPHFETQAKDEGGRIHLPPWRDRKNGVCWRGTTTGFCQPYSKCDRYKVVKAFQGVESASVKFYSRGQGVDSAMVPDSWMAKPLSKPEFSAYKVTVDVDGNANAWEGLRWKLRAGSVVVKAHSRYFAQWYYPELEHGRHLWLSDVENIVSDALSLVKNETLCNDIGKAARAFGEKYLSKGAALRATISAGENLFSSAEDAALTKDWRPRS